MQNLIVRNAWGFTVSVNGHEIYYEKVGKGDHVVLLMPGDWGTTADFVQQIGGMDKSKFTLIAWDPPGYGLSRPPERDFNNFFRKDAETAFQMMKALGIEKYSIMGWSAGGIAGMILSAAYPDTVNKLVIWGVKAFSTNEDREFDNSNRDMSVWDEKTRLKYFHVYGEELFKKLWHSYIESCIQIYDICKDDLKRIKCPTFLLHGDLDPFVAKEHAEYIHKNIKNARYHRYPYGGHEIHKKYGPEFNKLVEEFLLQE